MIVDLRKYIKSNALDVRSLTKTAIEKIDLRQLRKTARLDLRRNVVDMRLKKKADNIKPLDLRQGIQIEYQGVIDQVETEFGPSKLHSITATFSGEQIGEMRIAEYIGSGYLRIEYLLVNSKYYGLGVEELLYKKMGEIHQTNLNSLPLENNFVNPFAELKFRQAVSIGWLPAGLLSEEHTTRNYTPAHEELWKDLRRMVPEQYRGASRLKKNIKLADNKVDLRNLTVEYEGVVTSNVYEGDNCDADIHEIVASLNGKFIGQITFTQYEFHDDSNKNYIYFDEIYVESDYNNLGIGQLLYKKFGEVYSQQLNGLPVKRTFINPAAEYAFKKAISLGWIPESAFTESLTNRYYDWDNPYLKDLRKKMDDLNQSA